MSRPYYQAALKRAYRFALHKLEQNSHKGVWETGELEHYLDLLRKEVDEVEAELQSNSTLEKLALECADVMNFAAIILDIAVRRIGREPELTIKVKYHGEWMNGNLSLAKMWQDEKGEIWYEWKNIDPPAILARRTLPANA